jgi:hypothetical protein
MQRTFASGYRIVFGFAATICCVAFSSPAAWAQAGAGEGAAENPLAGVDIVKVEEDWSLDIANPEPDADCPQVVTVFGPADPSVGTHAILELNHGTLPDYCQGGMQLQAWYGDYLIGYHSQFAPAELNYAIEQVTFTTATRVRDGYLHLYVKNGHSLTWGDFGGFDSQLSIYMGTWRSNLNDWNAQGSITNSRVAYGANRVNNFVRTAVRYYIADENGNSQLYYTDDTDTYVHRLIEDNYAPDPVNQ